VVCSTRAVSGQGTTDPLRPLMKSRRLIVPFLRLRKRQGTNRRGLFGRGRSCPLWVKSRHRSVSVQCPLYPQKRTSELSGGIFVPKADICSAANSSSIRSPRWHGQEATTGRQFPMPWQF
jgi:hypothetical protein